MDARRKLRLLAEAMGALGSVFFFDYSGVAVAWRLFLVAGIQNGATEALETEQERQSFQKVPSSPQEHLY